MLVAGQRDPREAIDQERDQDRGEGELHIGDAHDQRIEAATDVAGNQAERDPEHKGKQHRGEADAERDARAVHDGGEDVAPLVVGAEGILRHAFLVPGRRREGVVQVERRHVEGILRRDPWREERRADADERKRGSDNRDRRAPEAPGEIVLPELAENHVAAYFTVANLACGRSSRL